MIRLLIVDDEPLVQVGMKSILDWSSYGIEICAAVSNGSEALLAIEKYRPEIVISDIRMPVMDGLQLLKTCRDRYGNLPVFIMLTSYEDFGYAREAINYGVDEYMLKMDLSDQNLEKGINSILLRAKTLKTSMLSSVREQETPNRIFRRLSPG